MLITLAFADDHAGLRSALSESLEASGKFKVITQASNGQELLLQMEQLTLLPDICLIDLNMPQMDGIKTLQKIRELYPNQKVLIYSMFLETFNLMRIYKYGANGAISKEQEIDQVISAIEKTYNEGIYIPSGIEASLAHSIKTKNIPLPRISEREIEFLKLYCQGVSQKAIAEQMNVTVRTVDTYRDQLTQKLGVKTRNGLLLFAIQTGIIGWDIA